jgi:hypothetical protein
MSEAEKKMNVKTDAKERCFFIAERLKWLMYSTIKNGRPLRIVIFEHSYYENASCPRGSQKCLGAIPQFCARDTVAPDFSDTAQ